jgi:hypothetical protein
MTTTKTKVKTKLSVAALSAATLIILANPQTWAKSTRTVHLQESGSLTTVPLDLDADNSSDLSGLGIYSGKSSLGRFTGQGVTESDPDLSGTGCSGPPPFDRHGVRCELPDRSSGCSIHAVAGSDVIRFDSTGDLLFLTNELGPGCLNFSNGLLAGSGNTGEVAGGTGKFSGATGTLTSKFKGGILSADAAGRAFIWFVTNINMTLSLP